MPRRFYCSLALLPLISISLLLVGPSTASPQSGSATASKIGAIHVNGQKTYTAEQIIAATGLKPGEPFDPQRLNGAAERLGQSGAFTDITFSYAGQGGLMFIDFKVEEAKFRACHFDNFVWLSSDEIDARLRKEVPLYNGMAPETGEMLDEIPAVLERLSKEKGVTVRVSRRVQQRAIGDPNWSHLYWADGANTNVQSVRFDGRLSVNPDELQKETTRIVGHSYSAFESELFGSMDVQPFFAERGYLRAKVDEPAMKILNHADGTGEFAVEITYPVVEGALYHWSATEWKGDHAISGTELDALTGMKANDVASAKKINEGWLAVKSAYLKRGYMEAQLAPEAVFDDATPLVQYRVTIAEGPQYRMGSFAVTGLPDPIAERVRSRWRLKAGDVYDGSYASDFIKKDFAPALQGSLKQGMRVSTMTRQNREQHTVDVTLKVE